MFFQDREEAGKKLAEKLLRFQNNDQVLVLGLPRGGVITAYEVAKKLNLFLDIVIVRKIGAPNNLEYAIGAMTEDGAVLVNEDVIINQKYLDSVCQKNQEEIKRRILLYRQDKKPIDLKNKTVIIIDDGIATGLTILAAVKYVKNKDAKNIIIAAPVAASDSVEKIKTCVNEVLCLYTPLYFGAVGVFYKNFEQISDKKVIELLCDIQSLKS